MTVERAHVHRQSWFAALMARPWAVRLLATLGVVGVTVGLVTPFGGRNWSSADMPPPFGVETWTFASVIETLLARPAGGHAPLATLLGTDALASILTLGGLALIPLLWRSLSPRWALWLRWTYTAWLALLILLVAGGLPLWWSSLSQPVVTPPPAGLIVGAPYFLPGALCFPLSVLLSGAALVLMFREEPERAPATEPRTGWQRVSALALTAGVLVWLAGFYLMPEATTAACPPIIFSVTQFAHGACAGLDSDQALAAAQDASLNPVALAFSALGWHFELLVAVGLITALGAWTRQLAARTLAWLAVWPLLALGVALVALQGAQVIAREGFQLTVATGGGWHVGPGMIGAFAGIGLVALGQAGLWREALRRNRAVSEPVNQVSAEAVSSHQRHVRPALREGEAIRAAGVALVALSR